MTIYKKYHSGAGIDGAISDFPLYSHHKSKQVERFYPDEWLIVNALRKYLKLRQINDKVIQILAEDWAGNGFPAKGNSESKRVGGEREKV